MVKLSRQKRKVTNKKRRGYQKKKLSLRGGAAAGPLAAHECPFTPKLISDVGYPGFFEEEFSQIMDQLRYVEIKGGDIGGRMGDYTPEYLNVFTLRHDPLKATELLFVQLWINAEGWERNGAWARGSPPKSVTKNTDDAYAQTMERLDSNKPLPLPGAIAKWTGGSGATAYIVCKSKIQRDLDTCKRIAECLILPYSPPGYDNFITHYQKFSTDGLLNVKEGENIYS